MNSSATNTASNQPPSIQDGGAWRGAVVIALLSLLVFGFAYSLAGVGLGQLLFPATANGSLVEAEGRIVGSSLVGQRFVTPAYFQGRPSAANDDPMAAAGSNQALSNPALIMRLADASTTVAARDGVDPAVIPGELLTQSGSGLDPDISPAGAHLQAERVAAARQLPVADIHALIDEHVAGRQLGVLGDPRVNVLALNVALDALQPRR